ncbi:hypothetical protein P152DRAFT_399045 [Eremomyces bilateralis CBS 781.70]|uniref:C2H2-type domain-containing protein n=1 Tax=Eremomyces bilateralis CBS 781.70 TaxID=1392243 RepID=A0A6G1G0H5_9PEZI|nr:uncharacterized protein P152DRAFT_399045 [Eremomyces bilateralis CBS 781.70]KAF1811431.1 hypothetical protein P152DRAFT_399045 [Eremomyces bilateralis CBS 781.70]
MKCFLPPHRPLTFQTYEEYELHYTQAHRHRCAECMKNLPSDRYLELHIAENHNPINQARKERGESIYQCFVEGCDKVVETWWKRRLHCIDKHQYPRNYDFFIVNDGIDRRHSMLQPEWVTRRKLGEQQAKTSPSGSQRVVAAKNEGKRAILPGQSVSNAKSPRKSQGDNQKGAVDNDESDTDVVEADGDEMNEDYDFDQGNNNDVKDDAMTDLTTSMSSLKFVPRNIRFGRGRGRGGFANR